MKSIRTSLLLLILVLFYLTTNAQDIIIFRTGVEIKSRIIKISDELIDYNKWESISGQIYTAKVSEVLMIRYENGSNKIFNRASTSDNSGSGVVESNIDIYSGTWIRIGSPNCKLMISKHGNIYSIQDNCGRATEATYTMDNKGNLTGLQGVITISYEKVSKKLLFNWPPLTEYFVKEGVISDANEVGEIRKRSNTNAINNGTNQEPLIPIINNHYAVKGFYNDEYNKGEYKNLYNDYISKLADSLKYKIPLYLRNIYFKNKIIEIMSFKFGDKKYLDSNFYIHTGDTLKIKLKLEGISFWQKGSSGASESSYIESIHLSDSIGNTLFSETNKRKFKQTANYSTLTQIILLPNVVSNLPVNQHLYLSFLYKDENEKERILQGFVIFKVKD